jgi:hypothetical protein
VPRGLHLVQGVGVEDVQLASPIHDHP